LGPDWAKFGTRMFLHFMAGFANEVGGFGSLIIQPYKLLIDRI